MCPLDICEIGEKLALGSCNIRKAKRRFERGVPSLFLAECREKKASPLVTCNPLSSSPECRGVVPLNLLAQSA